MVFRFLKYVVHWTQKYHQAVGLHEDYPIGYTAMMMTVTK